MSGTDLLEDLVQCALYGAGQYYHCHGHKNQQDAGTFPQREILTEYQRPYAYGRHRLQRTED